MIKAHSHIAFLTVCLAAVFHAGAAAPPPTVAQGLYIGFEGEADLGGGTKALCIIRYDGTGFSLVGTGMSGGKTPQVRCLSIFRDQLFAGGDFSSAGGVACANIAMWDGASWAPLGSGLSGGDRPAVSAMAVYKDQLYVAGAFTSAGGLPVSSIARWDGTAWQAMPGLDGNVNLNGLAVYDDDLYVAGDFTKAGGASITYVAKWRFIPLDPAVPSVGTGQWYDVPYTPAIEDEPNGQTMGLGVYVDPANNEEWLIVSQVGPVVSQCRLWSWKVASPGSTNGTWAEIGRCNSIHATYLFQDQLYVAGNFVGWKNDATRPFGVGKMIVTPLAPPSTGEVQPLDSAFKGVGDRKHEGPSFVHAMVEYNNKLYIGGKFNYVGKMDATPSAAWNLATCNGTTLSVGPKLECNGIRAMVVKP